VFEEFEKGVSLRDIVTDILRDGNLSISQVGAQLTARGIKLHRLAVAGYLKALADDGYLEEKEIPPAKTYRLHPGHAPRSLYEVVAERVRQATSDDYEATRLATQVLHDLFHRPIFKEELRRAGFDGVRGLEEVQGEDRQAARRVLSRTPLKLPFNDPAFVPRVQTAQEGERLRNASRLILATIIRDVHGVQSLALTSKQVTLREVEK
jgi:hypothetical protein